MWGLEYPLLFGLPENKLELIQGRTYCAFPFLEREQAEAHLLAWRDTLCRWKAVSPPARVRKGARVWRVEAAGFTLNLHPLPINLNVPLAFETFRTFYSTGWRRDLWEGQPPGCESGWEPAYRHGDIQANLWQLFGALCENRDGNHAGRVEVVLSDTAVVCPDQVIYLRPWDECLIGGQYFQGSPDLIAEVLSPASRTIDRGSRRELYRRHGVPHLWLLDPQPETVEVYELAGSQYQLTGTYRAGQQFRPALFPEETVAVDPLFDTQWKRHREESLNRKPEPRSAPEPIPEWLAPRDLVLGLEYLFLLGHPDRRWEIWDNRAPCVLAFGSAEEAQMRLPHFVEEAARWEGLPAQALTESAGEQERADVGRFHLLRRGRHVHLEVDVDARQYREFLDVYMNREAWEWGEE